MTYFMNKQTGELLTRDEMMEQFARDYGGNHNAVAWDDCYKEVVL